eukprot:scaffold347346_cov20-Prasinocladus_malaysianus.AAC.1
MAVLWSYVAHTILLTYPHRALVLHDWYTRAIVAVLLFICRWCTVPYRLGAASVPEIFCPISINTKLKVRWSARVKTDSFDLLGQPQRLVATWHGDDCPHQAYSLCRSCLQETRERADYRPVASPMGSREA